MRYVSDLDNPWRFHTALGSNLVSRPWGSLDVQHPSQVLLRVEPNVLHRFNPSICFNVNGKAPLFYFVFRPRSLKCFQLAQSSHAGFYVDSVARSLSLSVSTLAICTFFTFFFNMKKIGVEWFSLSHSFRGGSKVGRPIFLPNFVTIHHLRKQWLRRQQSQQR